LPDIQINVGRSSLAQAMTTEKLNPIKGVGPYIDTRSRDQNKYKELFELF
jgi:hypothetical protein